MPSDHLIWIHKEEGHKEGTVEHSVLEEKMGFQCQVVLGELTHAMVTAQPNIARSVTTLSKFSSAPLECHHQLLEGLTKHLQMTKSWGVKHCRQNNKFSNDPPDSDQPAPLPEAVGEFNVDISQPKLSGFVDASCGSELGKRRSIAGCVFTFCGGAIVACKSKTQTVTASSSTEAEFVAAFTAAKAMQCLWFVLQELGFVQDGPTEICIGNQAVLQIMDDNQAPTIQTRHLDTRFFSLQD